MKVYFLGGKSGLGKRVAEELDLLYPYSHEIHTFGSADLDIVNEHDVKSFFNDHEPEVLVSFASRNTNMFLHKYDGYSTLINEQVDVNVTGTTNLVAHCLRGMRGRGFGRIILASSVLSKRTVVGTSVYSASKAYLETLVRVAAAENAIRNVTINSLRMGYMDAGLTYKIPEKYRQKILDVIPSKKFGDPQEVALTIGHLIECPYINGSSIEMTGGLNGL